METPPLWIGTCSLRMETPLRGRSGGHTGAAPTISRVAPCPKVAGEVLADGQNERRLLARCSPMDKNEKRLLARCSPTDKIKNGCRRGARRRTKSRKGCRRGARRWTKSKKGCWRGARRRTKTRKGCWRGARRRYSALFIAGKVLAADIPCRLSQERCSLHHKHE